MSDKPDPNSPGPHVPHPRQELARKQHGLECVLLVHADKRSEVVKLKGDAYLHICSLLNDDKPLGRQISWTEDVGGIQIFYRRGAEQQGSAVVYLSNELESLWFSGPVIFAGRAADGQVTGISENERELVIASLSKTTV